MKIEYLADHTEVIPTLSHWFCEEWSHLYVGQTVADVGRHIAGRANRDKIPLALVGFIGEELVGTVCLKVHDMDTRKELTPWLAGLYVSAPWRRQGIGAKLVLAIEQTARQLGVASLFLYTPESEEFYARLGWQMKERTTYHGYPVTIMKKEFVL